MAENISRDGRRAGGPKVTIAIPTYNRGPMLACAIDSALGQTYPRVEVLVSDNASTDATPEILSGYGDRIRAMRQPENSGMARNWQACLDAASGEFFLLLSDDDYLEPAAVESLVRGYAGGGAEGAAFVYGRTDVHRPDGKVEAWPVSAPPAWESPEGFILACYEGLRYSPTGSILYRTSDLRQEEGFLWKGFGLVLDAAMMMRVAAVGAGRRVGFVDRKVFHYRMHGENATARVRLEQWAAEIRELHAEVLRRLGPGGMDKVRFARALDSYLVRFIFEHASHSASGLRGRLAALGRCLAICRGNIGAHSLLPLVYGSMKVMLPQALSDALRAWKAGAPGAG